MWLRRPAYRGRLAPSLSMPALRARSLVFPEWALSGASRRDILNEARAIFAMGVASARARNEVPRLRVRSSRAGDGRKGHWSARVQIIDNVNETVGKHLANDIRKGSRLSIAAACFSIYAYRELRRQLAGIDELRFIFTSPTFVAEQTPKEAREFYIPRLSRERGICGTEFEVRLRNELTQRAIAKECADWLRRKATFRSNVTDERMMGFMNVDDATYMPLKVNFANVMPIIFAGAILMLPEYMFRYFASQPDASTIWNSLALSFQNGGTGYMIAYALLILAFSFFWVANQFNPIQIADNLKKEGAFIPGISPGQPTADFLDTAMTRVTAGGAVFLMALALFPMFLYSSFKIPFMVAQFFGGTSLLIMVGVVLDTMSQLESHLTMRHYEGFLKSGRLRSRSGN